MVELVDTQDLKSCGRLRLCGFKSHSGYNECNQISVNEHFTEFFLFQSVKSLTEFLMHTVIIRMLNHKPQK